MSSGGFHDEFKQRPHDGSSTSTTPKPGVRTTEFWITIVTLLSREHLRGNSSRRQCLPTGATPRRLRARSCRGWGASGLGRRGRWGSGRTPPSILALAEIDGRAAMARGSAPD